MRLARWLLGRMAGMGQMPSINRILLVLSLIAIAHPADCANVTNQTETQILIDGDGYVLENGERWTFYQNYTVVVKGVDAKGEKAWIELLQNDVTVVGGIFEAMDHLSYVKKVEIFNMTIDQIYVGSQNDLVFFYVRQYPDSDLPACDPPPSDATPESGSNASDSDASVVNATSTPAGGHDPDPNSVPGCGGVVAVAAIVLSWLNRHRAGGKRRRI